jgi:hypothetical protein
VAGGLVNPPDREVSHPRAQKNERRPDVSLATVELLDGARDQRKRLVSPAGEGVCGAEGRGDGRCPGDELPRPAEVVASLKDRGRAWEIPATEVVAVLPSPLRRREHVARHPLIAGPSLFPMKKSSTRA